MASNPAYCLDQVRLYDPDRYLCDLFAPVDRRGDLLALHAFNLEAAMVRERAREPIIGQMRLQWWREAIAEMSEGRVREHPVAHALAAAIMRHHLEIADFERLLTSREQDLDDSPPASIDDLIDYAEGTSSTLVRLGLQVLGAQSCEARACARDVGIAWALVGLLRAVPHHARQRRIRLPGDLCRRAGLDIDLMFERGAQPALTLAAAELAELAAEHLRRARERRKAVPTCGLAALLPTRLADLHLTRLRRARFDPFASSFQAPAPQAVLTLALARILGRY